MSAKVNAHSMEKRDIDQTMEELLTKRFRLGAFRDGQRAVIKRLLEGKSAAAIFPTGGGKSLCYQLPAISFDGLTLVVSPLMALMREQVDALNALDIPAARLDSSLTAEESRNAMQAVKAGEIKLLYVAPERFFNERFRDFISQIDISLFAIDEAHCISQWGHNFRPDYLKLAKISQELKPGRVLALTATATPAVLDDIRAGFGIEPSNAVQTPFYRSNLRLRFTATDSATRNQLLVDRLSEPSSGSRLVYVTLQKTAEAVAEYLSEQGVEARAYHAGLPAEDRAQVQDWFMTNESATVVATIAFGMGIDKSNIREIYHYNSSKSVENYAQEVGRAGRDGQDAVCETFIVSEDRVVLDNFAYGDTPTASAVKKFVEFLVGQPENFFVSYYTLAYETDIRESVVRTLLTSLELNETLVATSPRYESYKFKPRLASADILGKLEDEPRKFASSVLAMVVKKKIWCKIDLAAATDRLGCERQRIVKMLDYFAEQGWIELHASKLVYGYRKNKPITDIEQTAEELYQGVLDREVGELARLNELYELMFSQECQSSKLSAHFGQSINMECGHCSVCEGQAIGSVQEPDYPRVGDSALSGLKALMQEKPGLLDQFRVQARFLCGLSSPKLIRARVTRHPLYGCCSQVPFDHVLEHLMEHA